MDKHPKPKYRIGDVVVASVPREWDESGRRLEQGVVVWAAYLGTDSEWDYAIRIKGLTLSAKDCEDIFEEVLESQILYKI